MWWSVFTLSQKATTAYRPLGSSKRKWTWKESRSSANEYWNFNRDLNWALGPNERPLVPSTNQNVNFLCDLREDAKQKNHKKFPFGKETSVASYYLARITSAIMSVFRSPIVFRIRSAHGTLSVRTCLWADFPLSLAVPLLLSTEKVG